VSCDPEDAHGHYLLGYALSESGRGGRDGRDGRDGRAGVEVQSQALACYREALRLEPEQPVYLRALAELLAARKQFAEALALAHRAVALAPERASNHITLGYVASTAGNRALARAAYEQALALEPNNSLAWNNLGCVDLAQGLPLHARERFREALRLDPTGAVARDNYDLVKPRHRPPEVYRDFAAFERQLMIEVWENVLFDSSRTSLGLGRGRQADEARLQAVALLWATNWRGLAAVWRKAPTLLTWLGVSAGLLRLGPAGAAVVLSSLVGAGVVGALALRGSPTSLRQRRQVLEEELQRLRGRWEQARADWLAGTLARRQRDAMQDRLLDDFCRFVEAQRAAAAHPAAPPEQAP
jgi:tetratricopeptide (TPR) repeat protein